MVKKSTKVLLYTVLVYGILVATHRGEFWPFSIYPMFSQAGNPWTRALVRDVTNDSLKQDWTDKRMDQLPGRQFAMDSVGINQNDLANFISKNKKWSDQQVQGLRKYFQEKLDSQALLVFKVRGKFSEEFSDSVAIDYEPYIYFSSDTTILNPKLRREPKVPDNL